MNQLSCELPEGGALPEQPGQVGATAAPGGRTAQALLCVNASGKATAKHRDLSKYRGMVVGCWRSTAHGEICSCVFKLTRQQWDLKVRAAGCGSVDAALADGSKWFLLV